MINGVSGDFILRTTLTPKAAATHFGLKWISKSSGGEQKESLLEIDPLQGRMGWSSPSSPSQKLPRLDAIDLLNKPICLEVVAKGTIVDVNVNGSHTLVHRLPVEDERRVTFFSDAGEVVISSTTVERLSGAIQP